MPLPNPCVELNVEMNEVLKKINKFSVVIKGLEGKLNGGTLKAGPEQIWHPIKVEQGHAIDGTELHQFWFYDEEAMNSTLKKQPWIVAGHILQVMRWSDYDAAGHFTKKFKVGYN